MSGRWASSNRREELPANWPELCRIVKKRDPVCLCRGCPKCSAADGCTRPTTDVDHLKRGTDHRLVNLGGKCRACHAHKSSREGAAAKPRERRAPERHPGLL